MQIRRYVFHQLRFHQKWKKMLKLLCIWGCTVDTDQEIFIHWVFLILEGGVSSAAYKKWEKAAIAGVSLVADAAEHLERTITNRDVLRDQNTLGECKPSTFYFLYICYKLYMKR